MSPLGVIFAVILCFTIVYCHPIAEADPEPEPFLPALIPIGVALGKGAGAALASKAAVEAINSDAGQKIIEDSKTWLSGAAETVKDTAIKAWESMKDFFG